MINGEPVEPGTEINVGTKIDLQIGKGEMDINIPVPNLIGKKPKEAIKALHYAYLNVGNEYFLDEEDTTKARVYKTDPFPLRDNLLNLGDKVDIWYRSDEYFDFDNYLQQVILDSLPVNELIMQNIIVDEE
jgi:beta-lactam-binding protein with PASTA domain